jgi:hypothetical protein
LEEYGALSKHILETIIPGKSMLSMKKWESILEPLDGIYLTVTDRIELLKSLYCLVKVELGIQFNQ